ncbi:MAG: aminotransferase class I/II-fold pyridoxal phosphate-dependent enzyme [Blastocatellia bacterium]|nr:aminotransferase class I/II-fold pyridoxal phosphate-dependent enzyme [Blastocatellia bacterium]
MSLNLNIRGLSPSATLAINERSNLLIAQGKTVYKWGLGQSPFPVPHSVVAALRENAHQKDYLPVCGLRALREAIADFEQRTQGLNRTSEDVMVSPGSKELFFILQLVYYGDLIIPTPSWVSYAPQALIAGRRVTWVPTLFEHGWMLSPENIEQVCGADPDRPRIVILNYPSNPTGSSYCLERLQMLAEVARRYRLVIVSDEIYGMLDYEGRHISIAHYYPEGTIVSTGLSKWCGAGGWRLGCFIFPPQLRKIMNAMAVVASETYTATSAPIQYAAVTAFRPNLEIDDYLIQVRRILHLLARVLFRRFAEAQLKTLMPAGAFYFFVDFERYRDRLKARGIVSALELCKALLDETGVALLPGHDFGRPPEELTARLAFVNFDGAAVLAAARGAGQDHPLDEGFVRRFCPDVLAAADKVGDWLHRL